MSEALEKAETALGQATQTTQEMHKFKELFRSLWKEMTEKLDSLLKTLREQSKQGKEQDSKINKEFANSIEKIIRSCKKDTGIPSERDIIRQAADLGDVGSAYNQCLHEVRAHLLRKFLSLDEVLDASLNRVKDQVSKVLVEHGRLGNLEGLANVRGAEFIRAVADLIPVQFPQIKYGFQSLSEFTLSYRGLVLHRIREHLDCLTPDRTTPKNARESVKALKLLHREAVFKCDDTLQDLRSEPDVVHFASVAEFLDLVLRAKGVKEEWEDFFTQERSAIWPGEFKLLGEQTKHREKWRSITNRTRDLLDVDSLRFID